MKLNLKCTECLGFIDVFVPGKYNEFRQPVRYTKAQLRKTLRDRLAKAEDAVIIHDGKGWCLEHALEKVEALELS
jgi:hypothetical protein